MIRRLLPYWQARSIALTGLLLLAVAAAVELALPWPVKWLVDYVFGGTTPPEWWSVLAPASTTGRILAICLTLVAITVVHKLGYLASQYLLIDVGAQIVRRLRVEVCSHLHRLSLTYHDNAKVGDSIYRAAYDTTAALTLVSQALAPIFTGVITLVGILIILLRLDPVLTLAAVAVAPIFWVLITVFGKQIDRRAKAYHENESGLVSRLQESLSSIRVVQAFSREPETNALVDAQAERSLTSLKSQVFVQLAFSACVGLAMSLGTALVMWLGAERVLSGRLSIGDILVFLAYLAMLYQPMNAISQSSSIIHSAKAQLRRVFEILDEEPEVKDKIGAISLPTVRGDLEFDRVSFAYADEPVLTNIDLKIGAGQTVAIVGATGTGKTTLASLLLRFYDPTEGAVRLDGHDLRDLRIEWLRGQVAVVLQDAILFGATIEENIAYARPDASAADITAAAKRAQADEFIRALPNGYQTVLGERGVNLSGGQRQRLAIARAFLKDAPILVLDEPTSALDALTENQLVESVRQLSKGRTTILISHRLSTVRLADKIVVLDNGSLVEEGTHSELISRPSHYRDLYDAQRGMSLSNPVS